MKAFSKQRRRFIKCSGLGLVNTALCSLPSYSYTRTLHQVANTQLNYENVNSASRVSIFGGCPEPCTPGNELPYIPATPAANRKTEAEIYLY